MAKLIYALCGPLLVSTAALAQTPPRFLPCYGTPANCTSVSSTNPLPVTTTPAPGGTQDVNVTEWAGVTAAAGSGAMTAGTPRVALATDSPGIISSGSAGSPSANVLTVQGPSSNGQYPTAAVPITGNSTGSTGAVVGTLAGTSAKTTYICGFDVSAIGGTAAVGPITVAGLTGSSMVYQMSSTAAGVTLSRSFNPCIPASTTNTAITITTTANGTASAVDVNSWGFQQ